MTERQAGIKMGTGSPPAGSVPPGGETEEALTSNRTQELWLLASDASPASAGQGPVWAGEVREWGGGDTGT